MCPELQQAGPGWHFQLVFTGRAVRLTGKWARSDRLLTLAATFTPLRRPDALIGAEPAAALLSSCCLITPVFVLTGGSATFPISLTFLLPGSSKPASTPFSISSDITRRPGEETSGDAASLCYNTHFFLLVVAFIKCLNIP